LELDLGWQTGQLPSTYRENDQFPHGLAWLSERLGEYGFKLGVWCAPFSISEFDPVAKEHPEWLIQDKDGQPVVHSEWFWIPHGKVYILDLSHPGAQQYLREKMAGLYARGVRYLKSDFIGCASDGRAKRRHDARVVTGAGTEAARIGANIIREAMPDALLLNCGGPEMPGTGHWPLLYTCSDTGNTGFIGTGFQETNYQTVACHLFKNRRWGILQPSCLCVGLPGNIEDARLRATIAFLAGGQIDISDTLVSLPEDRWRILTATLPPLGVTAEPVDLFEPILGPAEYGYSSTAADGAEEPNQNKEYPPGSVWRAHVKTDWDEWDLVGVFSYENTLSNENPGISRFQIPFDRLNLAKGQPYWAFEFWSGQFLGAVPAKRGNPRGYEHPGDVQDLSVGDAADVLDIAFFGPGAKLLCLRPNRPHPWIVGTGSHQSCGAELRNVTWQANDNTLSGELDRPAGEEGALFFADAGKKIAECEVDGQPAFPQRSANGAWRMSVPVRAAPAVWRIHFE
ncbi:MAG: alpha-galactosidase, partial [Candidatus Hydrogenedentes bacterium]|nr:alpha-galactosidase [Candidatus Hydrogenedentota bacterium]